MTAAKTEPLAKRITGEVPTPLLLSREFRWVYYTFAMFLAAAGFTLLYFGVRALLWRLYEGSPFIEILWVLGGLLCFLLSFGIIQARKYFYRVRDETVRTITEAALGTLNESDFEQYDRVTRLREEQEQAAFEQNVKDPFLIKSFDLSDVALFGESSWQLQPGVNILLGRNGYGKSLLLRTLAAMLQRNEAASAELFAGSGPKASLQVSIERSGTPERVQRDARRFQKSPGKIPILAIPDSRFISRRDTIIEAPKDKPLLEARKDKPLDLPAGGARHFLEDLPYGDRMGLLFHELCLDYLQGDKFDDPVFAFLSRVIEQLTDGETFEFHSVERIGANAFRLMVVTEGSTQPVPIQHVSQGTLSVLSVVGIVRSYLRTLAPVRRNENFMERAAIVLIDELDAHLHPLWQQRLTNILRTAFPNVQFVLTAHSPLVVQGCWKGEVSVLRRDATGGLTVELLVEDFVGTSIETIYKEVFRVEGVDPEYAQSASRASAGFSHAKRIAELDLKTEESGLSELERRERNRLVREDNMIARAAAVDLDEQDDRDRIIELEAQVDSLKDQLKLREAQVEKSAEAVQGRVRMTTA
jgi:hypothetical protein